MSNQNPTDRESYALPLIELAENIDIIPHEHLVNVTKKLCLLLLYADRCIPHGTTEIPADRRRKADEGVRRTWEFTCASHGIEVPKGAWAFK